MTSKRPLLPGDGPLARVRPAVAFVLVLGLFITGVWVGGTVGAVLLGVLIVAAGTLLAATWKVLSPAQRTLRVVVLLVLLIITVELVVKIPTR
ncbi:hypothetical protein [Lentzea sp. CA-135723]|uniref:hypothetical protein n=1 Tax=Lentzea sp. CA-135723 TaxID=3239950 RepID=UPI003D91949F